MGQTISEQKQKAKEEAGADEKECNDSLNSLLALANTQADQFYQFVLTSGPQDKLLAVDIVIQHQTQIKCSVDSNTTAFQDALKSSIKAFASGEFVDGLCSVVGMAMQVLVGNYNGNISRKQDYIIVLGLLGGIVRVDYLLYSYQFTSDHLISISKNVLLADVVISSACCDTLNENTIRALVQTQYGALPIEEQKQIAGLLIDELARWKKKNAALLYRMPAISNTPIMNGSHSSSGVECDGCGVKSIIGTYYKCSLCPNLAFCGACEQNKDHPHSVMKTTCSN
jgi:hypothetical protein